MFQKMGTFDNRFNREAGEACDHPLNPVEGVMLMSTYEEFMVLLAMAMLIVTIWNMKK